MVAGWLLTRAATASKGTGICFTVAHPDEQGPLPVTPSGESFPSPVMYTWTVDPAAAGRAELLGVLSKFRIAPWPLPLPAVKIPGAVAADRRLKSLDDWPRYLTWTNGLVICASSYGTTQLICVALT